MITAFVDPLPSLETRFALYRTASRRVKDAAEAFGLRQIPLQESEAANGMTALYFPPNVAASDLIPRLLKRGVVVAGGLHVEIKGQLNFIATKLSMLNYPKDTYFRIGHMGISVVETSRGDVDKIISALGEALQEIQEKKGSNH